MSKEETRAFGAAGRPLGFGPGSLPSTFHNRLRGINPPKSVLDAVAAAAAAAAGLSRSSLDAATPPGRVEDYGDRPIVFIFLATYPLAKLIVSAGHRGGGRGREQIL